MIAKLLELKESDFSESPLVIIDLPIILKKYFNKVSLENKVTVDEYILSILQAHYDSSNMIKLTDKEKISLILKTVAIANSMEIDQFITRSRKREYAYCRFMAMYFIKKYTKVSLREIGEIFSGIDHSSALHGISKFQDFIDTEKKTKELYFKVNNILKNKIDL